MDRPLSGIRVIGVEQYISGPYCTLLLADAGAEVIKIERPGSGDPRRAMPPFVEKNGVSKAVGFMAYNRNKKSLALDLRSDEGKDIYKKLVACSDVVVENIRPGSMKKMGLGYDDLKEINPRLVCAFISGFGRLPGFLGPYSGRPAFDIVAEAMSGIMHLVGFEDKPPSWTIYGMADIYSGLVTAYGIQQALFMRQRTGQGQLVDSSMLDNMISLNESMIALYSAVGQSAHRGRPRNLYPRGAYKTKDGYIALNVPDNIIWRRLCEAMGREDLIEDERASTGTARAANAELPPPHHRGLAGPHDPGRCGGRPQRARHPDGAREHRRGHLRRPPGGGPGHPHDRRGPGRGRHPVRPHAAASVLGPHPSRQGGARPRPAHAPHSPGPARLRARRGGSPGFGWRGADRRLARLPWRP